VRRQAVERLPCNSGAVNLRHARHRRETLAAGADLERIAIDQLDQRLGETTTLPGLTSADDVATGVNRLEGAGQVAGGVDQKRPVGLRERLLRCEGP